MKNQIDLNTLKSLLKSDNPYTAEQGFCRLIPNREGYEE